MTEHEIQLPEPTERATVNFEITPTAVEAGALAVSAANTQTEAPKRLEITWKAETDPQQRVEQFLDDYRTVLSDSSEAWQTIRKNQDVIRGRIPGSNRREKRKNQKMLGPLLDPATALASIKADGQKAYSRVLSDCDEGTTYETYRTVIEENAEERIKEVRQNIIDAFKEIDEEIPEGFIDNCTRTIEFSMPYAQAFLARDTLLDGLQELVADDQTAIALTSKVEELAGFAPGSPCEHPDFLEIIATHVTEKSDENILREIVYRTAPAVEHYSMQYINTTLNGNSGSQKKELQAAATAMKLLASIVETDFGIFETTLLERFAAKHEQWPEDMQAGLHAFHASIVQQKWHRLKELVSPFVRPGRLPITEGITFLRLPSASDSRPKGPPSPKQQDTKNMPSATRGRRRGDGIAIVTGIRGADHETITDSSEKQPISRFAIIGRHIKNGRYDLETVDSLNELYELSNLSEYVEKHASDKTLEPLFRAMLEHLTEQPYDPSCVSKLSGVSFSLEGDLRQSSRNGYRFKPQTFPKVSRGEIANATRVIFDVANINGHPTLVIYGAFIKQDIENMDGTLPKRK